MISDKELQERIDASPALRQLRDQLANELAFKVDTSVQFDPFLILTIISICVQLFIYCHPEKPQDLKQAIRDIRSLPPRRLIRLRRKANTLWRECCAEQQVGHSDANPILTTLYELGETADDKALDELILLAQESA